MAMVQIPQEMMGQTPTKKKKKKKKNNKNSCVYCVLCRITSPKHEEQEHVHSMLHHRELETVLGKGSFHECEACEASSMGLNEYAQHISTAQHKTKLESLKLKDVTPHSLKKTLGQEVVIQILERNKTLKKEEKKVLKKKRKKLKQMEGQERAEMLQAAAGENAAATLEKSKQVNARMPPQDGCNDSVFQNKENKGQGFPCQREANPQNPSGRLVGLSGEPQGRLQHPTRDQLTQSAQMMYGNTQLKIENTQTCVPSNPNHTQAFNKPEQWQHVCYQQNSNGEDFTSDTLPENALIFEPVVGSSQPGQKGPAQPVSGNGDGRAAPVRDVDVGVMLRQIRRTLGVREPCRAEREARKQRAAAGGSLGKRAIGAELPKTSAAAASASASASASARTSPAGAPSSRPAVRSPSVAPSELKQTVGTTQPAAADSNGPSSSSGIELDGLLDGQTSISQCAAPVPSPEPNIVRKVRIAHNSSSIRLKRKPALDKAPTLSGANSNRRLKSAPRFGIHLQDRRTDRESSTQARVLQLSEGFQWELVPGPPSGAHRTRIPPPPLDATHNGSRRETESVSKRREPMEPVESGAAREDLQGETEPDLGGEKEGSSSRRNAKKRKHKTAMNDYILANKLRGKKKKTKSNNDQDPMEQLLGVSLREDELSHSLLELDKSVVQARNALQAAYTEVQRLLLIRQQFTYEVNSLRAKRIEILQGMQGAYSGASNVAVAVQPSLSPPPSSGAFPASSGQQSPVALPTLSLNQEICQTLPVSGNPDTPVNPSVPLFHPDLLPLLLLSHPAVPKPPASALQQDETPSSESPARQREQVTRQRITSASLAGEEGDCDSEVKAREYVGPAAEKPIPTLVPERHQIVLDDDDGNESDGSVEVMEPSVQAVVHIDESDNEQIVTAPNAGALQEGGPPKSASAKFDSSVSQKNEVERKVLTKLESTKDASGPPEAVDVVVDEEPLLGAFLNHGGPVHGLQVHEGMLYTCSGDNTARAYSLSTAECRAVFTGHKNKVNCLLVWSFPNTPARLYTGSSDQTICCYSTKTTMCLEQISLSDQVLCLHVAWNILFAGLANGSVTSHDLKTLKQLDVFECHGLRGVSCLGTAQEGARRVLLVGSYDGTITVRDAKSGLLLRSLEGHTKTVLCMKVVNNLVFSGSSDESVLAHNIHTGELMRIYKGHGHAVTSVAVLGKVLVTACLDKLVRVYELESHDCLQVYGGHSNMVMCMAIHKSVIYTGCYDGSIQAVKLNLLKNHRCWWQNCPLIFGMAEHLVQHLLRYHTNPSLQAVKCCWRGCSHLFAKQHLVEQELPGHMRSHVENDSEIHP